MVEKNILEIIHTYITRSSNMDFNVRILNQEVDVPNELRHAVDEEVVVVVVPRRTHHIHRIVNR